MFDPGTLSPIATQGTLADRVADTIREAIIRATFRPGERLAEPALAADLGVSRSPVREALVRLESEGLLRREANRGFYVWNPTATDVDEILSLRVMMESLAAETIINKLTDEDFVILEEMFEQQKVYIEANRYMRLTKEDRRFHDYFVQRSNNSRLMEIWSHIMSQWEVVTFRRMVYFSSVPETVLTDHRSIIQAMQERDLDKVVSIHREINGRVADGMKEALHVTSGE